MCWKVINVLFRNDTRAIQVEMNRNLWILGSEIENTLEKDDMRLCRLWHCEGPDSNNR